MVNEKKIWQKTVLGIDSTIEQAIRNLDHSALKIVLIVDKEGSLAGTLSDGDIRRSLLRGMNLKNSVFEVMNRNPFVVPPEIKRDLVLQLMVVNGINQIPVVNDKRKVVGLHLWSEINSPPSRPNIMIIMAGGIGSRLRPYTENCPKPMLSVAGKPMLVHIIERAKLEGFSNFLISLGYLGEMIESYFGFGDNFGVNIDYLREDSPLGTAGALSLLYPIPEDSFVVTNGDVITDIRYGELLDFHTRYDAAATMALRLHEWQHPFGVVQTEGVEIVGFEEKPIARSHINAGIYALSPCSLNFLKNGEHCDMPTLFQRLRENLKRTVAYPMHEPWLDVGRPDDLSFANAHM